MPVLILDDALSQRQHRRHLVGLAKHTTGPLRVATAYVTEIDLLKNNSHRKRQLLISLTPTRPTEKPVDLSVFKTAKHDLLAAALLQQVMDRKPFQAGPLLQIVIRANYNVGLLRKNGQ